MQLDTKQKLILYFIKNVGFPKIKTTLIFKLLFLTDYESYIIFSKKITSYDYQKYHYGPFSQSIYNDIDYLKSLNLISCDTADKITILGEPYKECKYQLLKNVDIGLTFEEKTIADIMVKVGRKLTLKQIKDIVYSLPNVKNARNKGTIYFNEELKPKMKNKIKNLEMYKKLIKKMGLEEPHTITKEQSDKMVEDYYSWYESISRANREFLSG